MASGKSAPMKCPRVPSLTFNTITGIQGSWTINNNSALVWTFLFTDLTHIPLWIFICSHISTDLGMQFFMYSEQIFKIYQNDKQRFPHGLCLSFFLSKDYSVVHTKKNPETIQIFLKTVMWRIKLHITVRNVFLPNKFVNRSQKKRAAKYSLRLTVWTVTAQERKTAMVLHLNTPL